MVHFICQQEETFVSFQVPVPYTPVASVLLPIPISIMPVNNQSSATEAGKKSWFSSWFENDNSNFKDQIHHKLNEFEEYHQRRHDLPNPFAWAGKTRTPANLQQEMEEFFESAGFGALANHAAFRNQYQIRRQETPSGVQMEVQFPKEADNVAVEVLQEYPCVVQWRNGKDFQDQARLGDSIDCSRLSASLARNTLTLHAPRMAASSDPPTKPRTIPVTERDE